MQKVWFGCVTIVLLLELVRNLVAHGDAREGKWRGNWRMEWVASTVTPPPNVVYPALLPLMRTPRLPAVDWTDAPTDLNGLVRFGERLNLVSARVPSRSARAVLQLMPWQVALEISNTTPWSRVLEKLIVCQLVTSLNFMELESLLLCSHEPTTFSCPEPVAYPGILFGGGSTNLVQDRGQRGRESGGGSPLVRGSGGSCNLVQEVSFHMVKFS